MRFQALSPLVGVVGKVELFGEGVDDQPESRAGGDNDCSEVLSNWMTPAVGRMMSFAKGERRV